MTLLEARGITVTGPEGVIVRGVDLAVAPGRTVAVVGESGSGKSLTAKALTGLLPRGLRADGAASLDGRPLDLHAAERTWRRVRAGGVVLLLQDPFTSLSPVHRCGGQVAEALPDAVRRDRRARRAAVAAALDEVGLPTRVARAYPFELSGGQRQRVAIAAALAARPRVLVADEPTTALDVTTQAEILDLLGGLQQRHGLGLVLITHDLRLARERADEVAVMHGGQVVEAGPAADVLTTPTHAYTRRLLAAVPSLDAPRPRAVEPVETTPHPAGAPVLRAREVRRAFGDVVALRGVDVDVAVGECVAVVGESGSGKTTLARCVVGLETPDAGAVELAGAALGRDPRAVQVVFQDPYSALNPALTIGDQLAEALRAGGRPASEVPELLAQVHLPAGYAARRPRALSGGERQRVAIARALAPRPRLLVCDEPVSALDVSVQAQVLDLLVDLRDRLGLALLFVSHDLAVVRQVAHRVVVMKDGEVVERGPVAQVLGDPQHEYTRRLLASVPGARTQEAHA
ncbi:ABC transporter related protein [Xylanimonas cellulosilytica DSM 15894]|uniref:ABC transporter related protein n=1 Tax=Xylanimonas cellulosilytica (strain DSM 15894 / JCM 12276 / CECT 5975 / KCTC 9989 / LMG 20990 / NBRC 107835 / XIL07) TaxID=446471 RepID=D1C0G4_XYLCX|nr:ABC transporter ATP-binding protein [Xylanimonas cellulosilytica]ACZ32167.1 ABC transporter related protein [Xylanimonas cellulosilytica DSM 15894]